MKIRFDMIRTSSVLIASLLLTMITFGDLIAQDTVEEPFGLLLFDIGQPGSNELSFADSLTSLIEEHLSGLESIKVTRLNDPLTSMAELQALIDRGELDGNAAVSMMLQMEDSTATIICSYMSILDSADEGYQAYSDQSQFNVKEWPIDPESEQADVLVPLITLFIEGATYNQQGMVENALSCIASSIDCLEGTDLNEIKAAFHLLLGRNMLILYDDSDVALAEIDRAIELDSLYSDAYLHRGILFYHSGDLQAAYEDATNAVSIDSLNRDAVMLRGSISLNIGDSQAAINDFTRALELDSTDADALNKRGIAYQLLGNIEMSLEDYKAAIEVDPCFIDAYMNVVSVCIFFDDLEAAKDVLEGGLEANPGNPRIAVMLGVLCNDWEITVNAGTEGILISPDDPYFFMWRGMALEKLGDYAAALADYEYVQECFNLGNYGTVSGAEGQPIDTKIEELENFLEHPEGSLEFYVQRGMYHSEKRMYHEAVEDFTEALSIPGFDPELYYYRALCRERTGDISGARGDLHSFLDSDPSSTLQKGMAEQMLESFN